MAPLDGAIAFVQVKDVSLFVAEDLNFDMFGAGHETLEENGRVAKSRRCFLASFTDFCFELAFVCDDPHAPSAPAKGGFHDQGKPDVAGKPPSGFQICYWLFRARDHRHTGSLRQTPRGRFVPEQFQKCGRRSDESDSGRVTCSGESGVFREKSISGMNRIDALLGCHRDDSLHVQVGLDRALSRADEVGFIGLEAVQA